MIIRDDSMAASEKGSNDITCDPISEMRDECRSRFLYNICNSKSKIKGQDREASQSQITKYTITYKLHDLHA